MQNRFEQAVELDRQRAQQQQPKPMPQQNGRAPQQPPTIPPPNIKQLPLDMFLLAWFSFYIQSFGWLRSALLLGRWILTLGRRITLRLIYGCFKARMFVYTLSKGFVSKEEYDARQETCSHCPHLSVKGDHLYCGACRCPKWPLSRLHYKNWFKRHICPEQRHTKTIYPPWAQIAGIVQRRGCSSCGQAKAPNTANNT